jgi:hypothetical protein
MHKVSIWDTMSQARMQTNDLRAGVSSGFHSNITRDRDVLQAAELFRCKKEQEDIVSYLQTLLLEIIQQTKKSLALQGTFLDLNWSLEANHAYAHDWHNTQARAITLLLVLNAKKCTSGKAFQRKMYRDVQLSTLLKLLQVLRQLPKKFCSDVFCKLNDGSGSLLEGCRRALFLPQDLLCRWFATTTAVVDLRNAELTALQWSRLFAALFQESPRLTEIHIRVPDLAFHSSAPAEVDADTVRECLKDGREILRTAWCRQSTCTDRLRSILDRLQRLTTEGSTKHKNDREKECAHMMGTLAGVLPHLTILQHVGLHNLPLQTQLLRSLGHVLMDLPPSVTTLTLTTASPGKKVGLPQMSTLFHAIALVRSLRELHLPNWEVAVGDDGTCLEPLCQLPHLQAVYMPDAQQYSVFSGKLVFKEASTAKSIAMVPEEASDSTLQSLYFGAAVSVERS